MIKTPSAQEEFNPPREADRADDFAVTDETIEEVALSDIHHFLGFLTI